MTQYVDVSINCLCAEVSDIEQVLTTYAACLFEKKANIENAQYIPFSAA